MSHCWHYMYIRLLDFKSVCFHSSGLDMGVHNPVCLDFKENFVLNQLLFRGRSVLTILGAIDEAETQCRFSDAIIMNNGGSSIFIGEVGLNYVYKNLGSNFLCQNEIGYF